MRKIDKLDVIHIKKKADTYIKKNTEIREGQALFCASYDCSLNQQINYLEHHVIVFMKIAECLSFQKNYKNQTLNSVFGPIAQLDRATDF